ncbi:MAG: aminotransferase class V-fold PLP-dependent enzyme [Desulfobacterales bacterium]|nr:aminotransferase class V-fold PLP-dependent enzyme [Desulfobacterales bacterium]
MTFIPTQRHLFDVPDHVAYFNSAYNSPQLKASCSRLKKGAEDKNHPWVRTPSSFFEDAEVLRSLASGILDGEPDGFAVVPAASYGISTAARAIEGQLRQGDGILIIAEEFPSNVLPWRRTALETGAKILTVPVPGDGNWTSAILDRIVPGIKVVSVSTCHWTNGAVIDLAPISRACRDIKAGLVVDATQTLAAMPFSIKDIQPDFLVAAGYKWLLCPYGFGLLYVSEKWRDSRPLEEVWLARDNAEDFAGLANYSDVYLPGARRFDVGEKCTPTILPGAIAALEQIEKWGVENISESLARINRKINASLLRLGFDLPEESLRTPHMFGARLPEGYTGNLVGKLAEKNIFISQRGNAVRFAPHLHVSDRDVRRLMRAIEDEVE